MSHVTHMNVSCHTYKWVMSHIWMSRVTYAWVTSHICMSHVTPMNVSCHIYIVASHSYKWNISPIKFIFVQQKWNISHIKFIFFKKIKHFTHKFIHNHYKWNISHIKFILVLRMHDSRYTYEWVMSLVTWPIWISHMGWWLFYGVATVSRID